MNDTLKAVLFGRIIAKKLIAKNPGKQMLFTFESIGDQCVELAYAQEYKKRNKIRHLAIVTSNPESAVFKYFKESYDSLIPVSKRNINILLKFYKSDLGQIFRKSHPELMCAFYTAYTRSDLILYNPYVRLCDIEKMIFRIPKDTSPCKITPIPCDGWIKGLKDKGMIETGKTVLLNPYANSVTGVPLSLFKGIAKECMKIGLKVIASVHNDQSALGGGYYSNRFST